MHAYYDIPPASCSGTFSLDPWRTRIESIRNRTRCGGYLLYAIDEIRFS